MAKVGDKYFIEDEFKVIEQGFQPEYGEVAESVFSLGNEYMGVRGNFEEGYSGVNLRGSYFNGIYEEYKQPASGYRGISNITEYMVNSVDYFACRLEMDGEVLDLNHSNFRDFRRELDLKTGILRRSFIWECGGKELAVDFERFLSMERAQMAAQEISLRAVNFDGEIKVSLLLDFTPVHLSAGENLWACSEQRAEGNYLTITGTTRSTGQTVTSQARIFGDFSEIQQKPVRVAEPQSQAAEEPAGAVLPQPRTEETLVGAVLPQPWTEEKQAGLTLTLTLPAGKTVRVGRIVRNLICKNESGREEYLREKADGAAKLAAVSYHGLRAENVRWWEQTWEKSDIRIEGDPGNQQGIRFCIFQLFQTYHGAVPGTNIGAKGLTGEAYNGNAFWDTETYYLPFYLFNDPKATRNLLLFRYLTLSAAMERAKDLDCEGAFYPLATISGKECCNLWQHASLQLQASTAVAYGIWFYEKQTGDRDFVRDYGARMLVEISRMLASRGDFSADGSRYGYYGVMGPDEFQMMVNHNYYTNFMGKFTLEFTLAALARIEGEEPAAWERLTAETGITPAERERFALIAEKMYLPYDAEKGLFEQHDGYFNLPHMDIQRIPVEDFPLYHHWTYDRIYRNDMIKQPDVLMAMFLFNSQYTEEQLRKNYEYYEPRCTHESSLSPGVHSVLAAQLKKHGAAYKFFAFTTRMDLDNYNRNTREGLHTPSIASAWINIVYGFGGMRSDGPVLSFAPSIPARWQGYSFRITCRGEVLLVKVDKEAVHFSTAGGSELTIAVYGKEYVINGSGTAIRIPEEWRA